MMGVHCCAPIVLFVYNRPHHTRRTVEALRLNQLASKSDLIVYSDGYKNDDSFADVLAVRDYLKTITGFNSIEIIEREKNYGLAKSIISGVTDVVNKYGKVIVLEDDIVADVMFLKYMNYSLDLYESSDNVWHVTGWNSPIGVVENNFCFFWSMMECWGWGTWKNRWSMFEKNKFNSIDEVKKIGIKKFNFFGTVPYYDQLLDNKEGSINTWAVYWYLSIFKNNGLCLAPYMSLVKNIGFDGSGENCQEKFFFNSESAKGSLEVVNYPVRIEVDPVVTRELRCFFKKQYGFSFWIKRFLRRTFL